MMLKFKTLYGSPSISTVRPFLMSEVSMATLRAVFLWTMVWVWREGAKAEAVAKRVAKRADLNIMIEN